MKFCSLFLWKDEKICRVLLEKAVINTLYTASLILDYQSFLREIFRGGQICKTFSFVRQENKYYSAK